MFSRIKNLIFLDGMVLRCNPEAVFWEDMVQIVADFETAGAKAI